MATPMWFGTKQRFQWVPMPSSGIQRRNVFSSEGGTLDRGGAYVSRSNGRHVEFDFSFGVREAAGTEGLNIYQEYATGLWDDYATIMSGYNPNNLIYFCDPMVMRANIFAPHWAAPMLALTGDYPTLGTVTGQGATPANIYRQPSRSVVYSITHTANTLPTSESQKFTIPIPPGHSLRMGWSGSVTGTGGLGWRAHYRPDGTLHQGVLAPVSATGSTRTSFSVDGDLYDYVIFGLSRTDSSVSSATITSMIAQIQPSATATTVIGNHIQGLGNTGCVVDGDLVEDYIQADDFGNRRLKSLSFGLVEVGAWLP